jgi:hypothetical protein
VYDKCVELHAARQGCEKPSNYCKGFGKEYFPGTDIDGDGFEDHYCRTIENVINPFIADGWGQFVEHRYIESSTCKEKHFKAPTSVAELAAYWDDGNCGPQGDDYNVGVCGRGTGGGDCPKVRAVSSCKTGEAIFLEKVGQQRCSACPLWRENTGDCWYHYMAYYLCAAEKPLSENKWEWRRVCADRRDAAKKSSLARCRASAAQRATSHLSTSSDLKALFSSCVDTLQKADADINVTAAADDFFSSLFLYQTCREKPIQQWAKDHCEPGLVSATSKDAEHYAAFIKRGTAGFRAESFLPSR